MSKFYLSQSSSYQLASRKKSSHSLLIYQIITLRYHSEMIKSRRKYVLIRNNYEYSIIMSSFNYLNLVLLIQNINLLLWGWIIFWLLFFLLVRWGTKEWIDLSDVWPLLGKVKSKRKQVKHLPKDMPLTLPLNYTLPPFAFPNYYLVQH